MFGAYECLYRKQCIFFEKQCACWIFSKQKILDILFSEEENDINEEQENGISQPEEDEIMQQALGEDKSNQEDVSYV